jgi:hypothetical protein
MCFSSVLENILFYDHAFNFAGHLDEDKHGSKDDDINAER